MAKAFAMGWLRDYPDFRDFDVEHKEVAPLFQKAKVLKIDRIKLPTSVDLAPWCSPIEDQQHIGSCTAQAGAGLVEYFERRAFGKHIDASRLFLYKVTRNFLNWTGDTGAYLRSTIGAMKLFGMPPEEYWPYDTGEYETEPSAFCYAFAQNYQALKYCRLDLPGTNPKLLLKRIKAKLKAGMPSMFGFTVFESIFQASDDGKIPIPVAGERVRGGHAVNAVGFDDKISIKNSSPGAPLTKGALKIRNSWGTDWGDGGYGWLPYEYVLKQMAVDWWVLLKNEWIDTGIFKA